jgi:hypothetical protein
MLKFKTLSQLGLTAASQFKTNSKLTMKLERAPTAEYFQPNHFRVLQRRVGSLKIWLIKAEMSKKSQQEELSLLVQAV